MRVLPGALILIAVAAAPAQDRNPYDTPESAAQGAALFQSQCAVCHGARGEGGRGANLTSGEYAHGGSDAELFSTIRNGVAGTSMPSATVADDEVWKIVTFVRRLGSPGLDEKAPGDPVAGRRTFEGKGRCLACHSVGAEGGTLGPELTEAGRRRTLAYLEESIVSPAADVPLRYRAIHVVTRSGESIDGIRLNEDDVSIQLRDSQDRLRCFMKDDLTAIRYDQASLMPSYARLLTRKEIEDVVAYLSSLRGTR